MDKITDSLNEKPIMTMLMVLLVAIAGIGGIVISIVNPDTLSFQEYLDKMQVFALAVAGLGLGRAAKKGLENLGNGNGFSGADDPSQFASEQMAGHPDSELFDGPPPEEFEDEEPITRNVSEQKPPPRGSRK